MNVHDERVRRLKWAGDFSRPRNDDDTRWDMAERELCELCDDPDTRAAFARVLAVATALAEVIRYDKNPDGDCSVVNQWVGEAFGDDSHELASVIGSLAGIIAMKAAGSE